MRNFEAKVRCFISGIEVPVRRVVKSTVEMVPPVVEIDIPPTESLMEVSSRSMVQIFYYDKYDRCWRLFFDGETTPGKTYGKKYGKHFRTITAISAVTYLNDLPNKYLDFMDVNIFSSLEYAFYGMPTDEAGQAKHLEVAVDTYLSLPAEFLQEDRKTLTGYFSKFIDLAIGEKGWVEYYKNMGRRHSIRRDHTFIDNGRFADVVKAEIMLNLLRNINGKVIQARARTLDNLLDKLKYVDCSYVNVTTPCLVADKVGSDSATAEPDELAIYHDANSLIKHIVLPKVDNTLPPKCNVIYGDKNMMLDVNIVENSITRLMNKFYFTNKKNGISAIDYYPPELLDTSNDSIKKVKLGLLDIEKDVGMKPIAMNKDDVYQMMVNDPSNLKKDQEDPLSYARQYITREDFYKILYSRNTVTLAGDGFDPYSIVGLPGIISDVESGKFYYGTIKAKHETIDIENGNVGYSVTLRNAREIKDIREVTARPRYTEDGSIEKWEHHKIPGWHPSMYYDYDVNADNNGKSLMTSELYEKLLKGSSSAGKGWQCVIDGVKGEDYLKTTDVLSYMRAQYNSDSSYRRYKHREIVTMTEYFRRLLNDSDQKSKFEVIENLYNKIISKTEKRDKLDDADWGDNIFVEERQAVIKAMIVELGNTILKEG